MLRQILNASLISVFCLHPVWADDTEIYFGPVSGSDAQPNILFVLDASRSMRRYDCKTNTPLTPCTDGSPFGNLRRIDRQNAAFTKIVNAIDNVNVGVMRFSNKWSGGRVLYPVRDVSQDLCDGIPCDDNSEYAGTKSTVRQELIDQTTNMELQWGTPTVGALLEAANYMLGDPVVYGKKRWKLYGSSHPTERGERSRVSHPESYSGGTVYRDPSGLCTDADLSDPSCSSERIDGTPVYTSPIKNECQENHIILITDGLSTKNDEAVNRAMDYVGGCPTYPDERGRCAAEIADHLYNTEGIYTHTIGFNIESNWLEDVAVSDADIPDSEGLQTRYYEASSTDDLVNAVFNILDTIDSTTTTLVAPGATVDQYSRLSHREELYLSLFKPDASPGWQGNLKRYSLKGDQLTDVNDNAAVDANGAFLETSQSYWTGFEDGSDIAIGGAAAKLNHASRKTVTYSGTQAALFHDDNELAADNGSLNLFLAGDAVNLAPEGTARQSSTSHSGVASRAIDNNTSGHWPHASVTATNGTLADLPWWEVTLEDSVNVDRIVLHNRINCCPDRLNNVHVFVSKTPFGDATLAELIAQPDIWHQFLDGVQDVSTELTLDFTGQYVRVQLAQPGFLSLAEVQVFGREAAAQEEKENLVNWIRGQDVKDENNDGSTNDNRLHMGDPLHSTSVTVNYGGDTTNPDSVVFVGTNEGYLHAISSRTGEEEFAFMPEPLIDNIKTLYDNNPRDGKVYGMDGDLTLWINDDNGNGAVDAGIDSSDHAYLYAGMRRGGNKYYALNVTDRTNPQFMFSIPESAPAAFAELGQSWSKPVLSKILVSANNVRDVLIFAGGYDDSQDDKTTRLPDTKGRAIYIVDALNGSVIWSGQPTAAAGGSTKAFTDMQYSIPSDVTVLEKEGLASQIYVGDMGGQLWRFDIPNTNKTGADLVSGGVIAVLSSADDAAATRRFYHAPDLVLSKFKGQAVLNIGIGSGYRAHPLNKAIKDNFYQIRYPFKATGNYGLAQDDAGTTFAPIDMDDLYDTTENLIGEGDSDEIAAEREVLESKEGWFIEMERNGEKILGSSTTLQNVVRFISYVPGTENIGACAPDIGSSFFWTVNLADGTPYDSSDDGDSDTDGALVKADRWQDVPGGGLAPPVKTLFVETADGVTPTTVSGINVLDQSDDVNVTKRWYWAENPE